jgi:rRNA processing protein Krr1/Pno1
MIGTNDTVALARKAVEMLIEGSNHSSVYKWLEKQRRIIKKREILGDE